jgi:hypothetical protein
VLAAAERLRRAEDQRAVHALLAQPLETLSGEERDNLVQRLKATRDERPGLE